MDRVYIFDTTLRDGEQSPGASMGPQEKLKFAKQLETLNVDIIEAGFAVSSPVQFDAIRMIADEVRKPVICSLARAVEGDITAAGKAIASADRKRIHTFIATSPIHREHKLKMSKEEVLKRAIHAVEFAKTFTSDVEFSAEDATRTEVDYLCEVVEAVIAAGATTVNIPDTVGYTFPTEFQKIISTLFEKVSNIDKTVISVHCHNDLGMGVANSLAAVHAGARQIEVSMNGIGERAGNASLEEVIMSMSVRKDIFPYEFGINTREIYKTSKLLIAIIGIPVSPYKPVIGKNAFSHESGIHQDGFLKERSTYEIMTPEQIGRPSSEIVLGRHSGRHGLKVRLKELGYELEAEDFDKVFVKFQELADKKKAVYDDELIAIMEENTGVQTPDIYEISQVQIVSGNNAIPTATVRIVQAGQVKQEAATGNGPVDAIYKAIDRIAGVQVELDDYEVTSISAGQDAMGEVSVTVRRDGKVYSGHASDTDILMASAQAYMNAINKIIYMEQKTK
ncbi:MAG: 2-isopropylmalate synthase [Spirochaetes bacterium GWF1_51_8]|nr:MAG: 2-isopropylmalate synthase [Spirochaetes bacterium GWF1_51_8]